MNTMDNHVTLPVFYFLRLSIVLLLAVAASALPQQSELDFALRLRAMKGLADHLYGVPTPELDVFTTLRVANRADEELCFRRGSATVEHGSTSTVLAQGIVPEFCVEANGVRNVGLWAHGERKAWSQDVRDDVAAEQLRGELQFQVSLDLVDEEGTLEVTAHCTLHQNYTRTNCLSKITVLFYEGY